MIFGRNNEKRKKIHHRFVVIYLFLGFSRVFFFEGLRRNKEKKRRKQSIIFCFVLNEKNEREKRKMAGQMTGNKEL